MAPLDQTITVINKSGKVVKTSKHLTNLFNEAKAAYSERKAEIQATRRGKRDSKDAGVPPRRRMEELNLSDRDDARDSRRASDNERATRRKPVSHHNHHKEPRPVARSVTDSFIANDVRTTDRARRSTRSRPGSVASAQSEDPRIAELSRRHSDGTLLHPAARRSPLQQVSSDEEVDMDLAYGELPPPLPERKYDDEVELRAKMSGLQRMLDECNCMQHSVTAIIANLQKNPEALAAVGLTLAEISNLAARMAPGALTAMRASFPAIVALLATPEFAIAVGVGVGVTIIAFGGYKIIKKMNGRKDSQQIEGACGDKVAGCPACEEDELRELHGIERWRRGIAHVEAESVGTTVDGEFITPHASRTLIESGKLEESDLLPTSPTSSGKRRRSRRSVSGASGHSKSRSKSEAKVKAKKQPSGISALFKSRVSS